MTLRERSATRKYHICKQSAGDVCVVRRGRFHSTQQLSSSAALSLHSTPLFDFHFDASHAVPPVMSIDDAAPRPTRALPL